MKVEGHAHPLSLPNIMSIVVVYTLAERADILPLFLLYPYNPYMYSVGVLHCYCDKVATELEFLNKI